MVGKNSGDFGVFGPTDVWRLSGSCGVCVCIVPWLRLEFGDQLPDAQHFGGGRAGVGGIAVGVMVLFQSAGVEEDCVREFYR